MFPIPPPPVTSRAIQTDVVVKLVVEATEFAEPSALDSEITDDSAVDILASLERMICTTHAMQHDMLANALVQETQSEQTSAGMRKSMPSGSPMHKKQFEMTAGNCAEENNQVK